MFRNCPARVDRPGHTRPYQAIPGHIVGVIYEIPETKALLKRNTL